MTRRSVAALSSSPDSRREGRALAPGKGSRGTLSTCLWFSWCHWCQTLLGPRETARPSGGGRLYPVCTVWARRSEVACPTTWLPGTLELLVVSPSPCSPTRWSSVPAPAGGRGQVVFSLTYWRGTVTRRPWGPALRAAFPAGSSRLLWGLCPPCLFSCERKSLSQEQSGHWRESSPAARCQSLSSSRGPGPCSAGWMGTEAASVGRKLTRPRESSGIPTRL